MTGKFSFTDGILKRKVQIRDKEDRKDGLRNSGRIKFIKKYSIAKGCVGQSNQKVIKQEDEVSRKLTKQCCLRGTRGFSSVSQTEQPCSSLGADSHSFIGQK